MFAKEKDNRYECSTPRRRRPSLPFFSVRGGAVYLRRYAISLLLLALLLLSELRTRHAQWLLEEGLKRSCCSTVNPANLALGAVNEGTLNLREWRLSYQNHEEQDQSRQRMANRLVRILKSPNEIWRWLIRKDVFSGSQVDHHESDSEEECRRTADIDNLWPEWWGNADSVGRSPFDYTTRTRRAAGDKRKVLFLTG